MNKLVSQFIAPMTTTFSKALAPRRLIQLSQDLSILLAFRGMIKSRPKPIIAVVDTFITTIFSSV